MTISKIWFLYGHIYIVSFYIIYFDKPSPLIFLFIHMIIEIQLQYNTLSYAFNQAIQII